MATYSALPATLNLVATVGNDFTLSLTVTENGSPWVATGATLATDIITDSGTVVATDFTTAASTGTVSLSLTDTNTTTLGVGVYSYRLSVTKSSLTRDWIAGTLSIVEAGQGGSSTSSASLSITNSAVTLSLTSLVAPLAENISVADAGGYYTGTTVEAVLAELKTGDRPRPLSSFPGVTGDGVTDDTAAIQAAIDTGIPILVGRSTHLITQLVLNSKTRIEGFGYDSWFKQKAGTTGDMIVLANGNVEQTVLRNIRLMGNKTVQSAANAGISYDNTGFTGGTYSDPHHEITNVIVELCKGNGVELIGKASECHLTNVFVNLCDVHGFYLDWADNYLTDCVASDSGQAGFYLTSLASNTRLVGCKAFFNGSLMAATTDRGEGFYLASASGNELVACEAQDNYGHGFSLSSAFDNVLTGCGADSNGQYASLTTSAGFHLLNASRNKISGYSKNRSGKTTQDYGVYLDFASGTNTANDVNLQVTANNTGAINVWTVSTSGTNNSIVLGASNGGMQRLGTGATPDIVNGSVCYYVMTSGMTVNNVTNRWPGMRITFLLEQDGTGGRVVSWNSAYKLDPAWVPDTTASKANTAEFIFDGSEYKMIGGATGLPA